MNVSDEELYGRYLAERSEDAFRILLERHREGLLLFIDGFVHNLSDSEEIMLDSFAEVAAGRTLFSGRSSFKTWLFSIGKKLALMHLRKIRRELPAEEDIADGETPELAILKEERDRQLYLALEQINEEYRRILILLYFEQMTHEDAARVMGKNRRQIYHLAERGRKALREKMEKMGFADK